MKRIITDEQGEKIAWFDDSKAIRFSEERRFDGRNMISVATNAQWEHEAVYRTAKGKWVLNKWSDWQGSPDHYHLISEQDALQWIHLCSDDQSKISTLPEGLQRLYDQFVNLFEA